MQEFQNFILRSLYVFSSKERFLIGYVGLILFYLISSCLYKLSLLFGEPTHSLLKIAPLFIAIGPLFYAVVIIIRSHFFDLSSRQFEIFSKETFRSIGALIWMPSVAAIAVFATFWLLLAGYHLITLIPYVGPTLDFFLGFFPFVCTTMLLFYAAAVPILIFVMAPPVALNYDLFSQLRRNNLAFIARSCVTYVAAFLLAIIPLLIVSFLIYLSNQMLSYENFSIFSSFFRILIISTYLAPALLFFCGMSLETYAILIQKHQGEEEEVKAEEP